MVDDNVGIGMLLVDTPAASCEAFCAYFWIFWGKDTSDLTTTA